MPELPEVESLRRSLIPYVVGHSILDVEVKYDKLVSGKGAIRKNLESKKLEFEKELMNEQFVSVDRRAKNLIFKFKSGKSVLVHLKMTGQLVFKEKDKEETVKGGHPIYESELELPHKHTYIIFEMDNGTLFYNDVRVFGYLLYYGKDKFEELLESFADLGLEPDDELFTLEYFQQALSKSKSILKSIFLNQKIVVGLGNIYCDEVCFEAGVRPNRKANTLTDLEVQKLYEAIGKIIPLAIEMGGSSVANYLLADGKTGNYTDCHKVYGRGGMPCLECGSELEKIKLAGRTTVYCKNCQK